VEKGRAGQVRDRAVYEIMWKKVELDRSGIVLFMI
jgi:hypothetical protein